MIISKPVWCDVIFSNSQWRLGTRKINGGCKFSDIKAPQKRNYNNNYYYKNMSSNVHNKLKFAKISWKDLLCMKMSKNGHQEFDHSGI